MDLTLFKLKCTIRQSSQQIKKGLIDQRVVFSLGEKKIIGSYGAEALWLPLGQLCGLKIIVRERYPRRYWFRTQDLDEALNHVKLFEQRVLYLRGLARNALCYIPEIYGFTLFQHWGVTIVGGLKPKTFQDEGHYYPSYIVRSYRLVVIKRKDILLLQQAFEKDGFTLYKDIRWDNTRTGCDEERQIKLLDIIDSRKIKYV